MSFAIEVAGEAAPLNAQQIFRALQSASSHQQQLVQTGTKQLQTWEAQRGYYPLLQAAFLDKSLPTEIRYLAVIQLKNGFDKYWRKQASNAINADEKAHIRSQLLASGIDEADPQLGLHYALAISKVVRIDYPVGDWDDVLTVLISMLRTANETNQLHLRRGLLILLQIIKELSIARLRRSQTSLQSTTPEIVFLLSNIYTQKVAQWQEFLSGNGDDEGGAIDGMENSLLALKILRRLLIAGYEYPNQDKDVQQLWSHSQQQFGQFLTLVSTQPAIVAPPAKEMIEKHLIQLAKLHVQMSTTHPAAFALLPNSLDLTRAYWGLVEKYGESYASSEAAEGGSKSRNAMERLSLKGLVLLRHCLKMVFSPTKSFKYRAAEIKAEQESAIDLVKSSLWTNEFVLQIANIIVTKFFVFRKADLDAWEEEPDEWEIREEGGGDTWEFEIRPCSEKLFMDLVINFKQLLVQPLLGFFNSVAGTSQGDVVTKDSIYTAMGLSAAVVFEAFDFDSFLASTLVNDIQQSGDQYKILRRRIAILIGQWVTIKISAENRPLVYQIFQHLLDDQDQTNDQVVRITAARQLKNAVDDYCFDAEGFTQFAENVLARLMALIREVDHAESKMAVLETIRVISVRLEQNINPFADQIVSLLPGLWEASGDEHLMKQAILTLLSTLTASMKEQSERYHPLVLPLIHKAIQDPEMQVYLLEESLDLWSGILAQANAPASGDVVALAEFALPLLEIGSDILRAVLSIVDSYVLLAPETMLADGTRLRLLSYMTSLLGVSKRELAGMVTTIVENLILAAQKLGGTGGVQVVVKDLFESGYIEKVMEGLHDAWECHQTSGPNTRYPKLDDVVETDYLTILARIALADPETFLKILESVGDGIDRTWNWLSTEWFLHLDAMANINRQKLSCLALTRFLELQPPMTSLVLTKLQDYFAMWTTIISEMQDGRSDGGDNLVWLDADSESNSFETPEDVRKRLQAASDPVHSVHTFSYVKEKLSQVVQIVGGAAEFQNNWAVNVDAYVLKGFDALSNPPEVMP